MQFPDGFEDSPFTREVVVIDPIIFKIGGVVCRCQSQKYHFIPLFDLIKAGSWQKIFFCSVLSLYMFNVFLENFPPCTFNVCQEFSHLHIYFILHIYLVHQSIQWPLRNFYTFYHLVDSQSCRNTILDQNKIVILAFF